MTKEEFEKDYYADRPTEPFSDDDNPSDWANIAHYAEENLAKAYKRIVELETENVELKKSIKYVNTICERKSVTNSQLTELAADSSAKLWEAKKIIKRLLTNRPDTYSGTDVMANQAKMFAFDSAVKDAVEYLNENKE